MSNQDDNTGLTEDDIVTWDDLPDALEDAIEEADIDVGGGQPDFDKEDAPWIDEEAAANISERKMTEFMHHIAHESCDTPECKQIREEFGLDGGGDPPEEGGGDGAGADDEPEKTESKDDDDTTPEDDSSGGDTDGDSDGDSGSDENTNIFGEPV